MKLLGLTVQALYGCYDYNVTFNSDVTFIYGTNGCGKTTILNITEAIITGQLYKLFGYTFNAVELLYAAHSNPKDHKTISITRQAKDALSITFNNELHTVERLTIRDEMRPSERNSREMNRQYFNQYRFLILIKETFNYVYLPLNRSSVLYDYDDDNRFYMARSLSRNHIPLELDTDLGINTRDVTMIQIESLISAHYSRINATVAKISDDFRDEILKSLLSVSRDYDFEHLFRGIIAQSTTVPDLQKTKNAYIRMLKELKIVSKAEENNYSEFFDEFINELKTYKKGKHEFNMDLLMKYQEISKINVLVSAAEKTEQEKAEARKPVETFLNTMNEFVSNSEDGKRIQIDSTGTVFFVTKYSDKRISIQHLSSGEKQLITFFANLIFSVKSDRSGIFVVDEPELSLHLSWQKIFVEKTLEINKNIQLIFATHSPEIIGKHRDKMYRLEKKYSQSGGYADE